MRMKLRLAVIGAVQFGLMYVLYLRAFSHLQSFEVALLTITTPFFVTLLDGALQRQFVLSYAGAALLSIAGAAVIVWHGIVTRNGLIGVLLVQASNICFAVGQIAWRETRDNLPAKTKDSEVFAWPYLGAVVVAAACSAFTTPWSTVHVTFWQAAILVYLGVIASGVCFFWWNIGATHVNAGTLAVFNNVKIPLAVACSLLVFGEHVDLRRLALGGLLMAAGVWLAELTRAPKET
jgi:drug/metabolite transporter (DMT)-like permease